jgi:hypothetical protein
MDKHDNRTNPTNAAFSSYLSTAGESGLKVARLVQHPPSAITTSQTTPSSISLERAKAEQGEISVFGAERYFNMKLDDHGSPRSIDSHASHHGLNKDHCVDRLQYSKPKSRPGTPSVISEGSWNSQATFLPCFQRKPSQNMQKKVNGKIHFSGFICSRSCSDKKGINIRNNIEHGRIHGKEVRRKAIDHAPSFERSNRSEKSFQVPISSSRVQNLTAKSKMEEEKTTKEEEPRKSREVFGSHDAMINKGGIAMNLERKLSVLTWDAIPKSQNLSTTSGTGCGEHEEDMGSDASSDLFEIENLSSSEKPLFNRQASDGMSTKYEPSEASIEWSVVTASAADNFSLNTTAYDEKKLEGNNKKIVDKEVPKSRPRGSLISCKSHKAVNVAETAHKTNEKAKSDSILQRQMLDSSMSVGKLQP